MMRICLPPALLVGILATFSSGTVALAADAPDPAIGGWTLNLARSKFSPSVPYKSQTRTYAQTAQGVLWTFKGVAADSPISVQSTCRYDGKDCPVTGSSVMDTLSLRRVNAHTVAFTGKRAGKVTETGTRKVSADGKVLTVSAKGTDAKGVPFNDVEVFDKQ